MLRINARWQSCCYNWWFLRFVNMKLAINDMMSIIDLKLTYSKFEHLQAQTMYWPSLNSPSKLHCSSIKKKSGLTISSTLIFLNVQDFESNCIRSIGSNADYFNKTYKNLKQLSKYITEFQWKAMVDISEFQNK